MRVLLLIEQSSRAIKGVLRPQINKKLYGMKSIGVIVAVADHHHRGPLSMPE